ncbi:unnamed protein product [Rhizophagus irregularis]|nr:unnamed protein product [Rhizophagus irregularis]CAB5367518.1 unnamed protein product [Rhizophagus irregularis]
MNVDEFIDADEFDADENTRFNYSFYASELQRFSIKKVDGSIKKVEGSVDGPIKKVEGSVDGPIKKVEGSVDGSI